MIVEVVRKSKRRFLSPLSKGFPSYLLPLFFCLIALTLAACSSGEDEGSDPFGDEELATFRVGRVTSTSKSQQSIVNNNELTKTVYLSVPIIDVATGNPVPDDFYFSVYEGSQFVVRAKVISGSIQWSKVHTYDKSVTQEYMSYTFRILGEDPHSGVQFIDLAINFEKTGNETTVDLKSGEAVPRREIVEHIALGTDGTMQTFRHPPFYVHETLVKNVHNVSGTNSPSTGTRTQFDYDMHLCIHSKKDNKSVKQDRTFTIKSKEGVAVMIDNVEIKAGIKTTKITNDRGCFDLRTRFKNFQHFSAERWFTNVLEICSENKEVAGCVLHKFYLDPWRDISSKHPLMFADGRDLEMVQLLPPPDQRDETWTEVHKRKRAPRIIVSGYAFNFIGRTFGMDQYLQIHTVRNYDLSMEPRVQRWSFDHNGYVASEKINGKFTLRILLNRTHGEAIDSYGLDPAAVIQLKKDETCFFSKENIYILHEDIKIRKDCYHRANMDIVEVEVNIKDGVLNQQVGLKFSDLRYVLSRNILYMELEPIDGEKSGIKPHTFVGAFSPIREAGFRRLNDFKDGKFVQPDGKQYKIDDLNMEWQDYWEESLTNDAENGRLEADASTLLTKLTTALPAQRTQSFVTIDGGIPTVKKITFFSKDRSFANAHEITQAAHPTFNSTIWDRHNTLDKQTKADLLKLDFSIETVKEIIEHLRSTEGQTKRLVHARMKSFAAKDGLGPSIQYYKMENALESIQEARVQHPETLTLRLSDLELVKSHIKNKTGQLSETAAESAENLEETVSKTEAFFMVGEDSNGPDEIIKRACQQIYPLNNQWREEAEEYAKKLRAHDVNQYETQRLYFCKMAKQVVANVYGHTALTLESIPDDGACHTIPRFCAKDRNTAKGGQTDKSLSQVFWERITGKSPKPMNRCAEGAVELENEEFEILKDLTSGRRDLMEKVFAAVLPLGLDYLDMGAAKILTHFPYMGVRNEVVRRRYGDVLELDNRLIDPNDFTEKMEPPKGTDEHDAWSRYFELQSKQDRCIKEPAKYLIFDLSKHVMKMHGRATETLAGNTNITVRAAITLSKISNDQIVYGSAKESQVGHYADVNFQSGLYTQGGGMLMGTGAFNLSAIGLNGRRVVQTFQGWIIRNINVKSDMEGANASLSSGKTVNAEYVTFGFNADIQECLSIQPRQLNDKTGDGGILICDQKIQENVRVQETWWYAYLYFRNYNSPLADVAGTLVQRPWTLVIRGQENYDRFKTLLSDRTKEIHVQRNNMPDPREALTNAYRHYRKSSITPGLLERKRLILVPKTKLQSVNAVQ